MMKGAWRRGPERWSERASRSLPTPGSPESSTWTGGSTAKRSCSTTCFIACDSPTRRFGIERQVLLPRMARQDRLVPADVVHQAQHQQVAEGAERGDRRPLLGREAREGGGQRVGAVERDEGVIEDPGRRLPELAQERAPLIRAAGGLAVLHHLAEQRLAARQPPRVRGHHQLESGPLQLPHQQEDGAAAEVRQHLVQQRLRGRAALGVAEHPLADPVQVLDHPERGDRRRPVRLLLLHRRGRSLLRPGGDVLDEQGHPAQPDLVQHLERGLPHLAPAHQQPLARPEILDPQLVAVVEQPSVLLRHPRVRQIDVALGPAPDDQLASVDRESPDSIRRVGNQSQHRGKCTPTAQQPPVQGSCKEAFSATG